VPTISGNRSRKHNSSRRLRTISPLCNSVSISVCRRLRAAGEAALDRYLVSQLGRRQRVLVERGGVGRTEGFAAMRLGAELGPGSLVEITPATVRDGMLAAA